MVFKKNWAKKKQNNLIVLAVLTATLLAAFLAGGEWQGVWGRAWGRLWGSVTIRWEKIPDEKQDNTEALKNTEDTERKILDLIKDLQGIYGVYGEDLETGVNFGINEDKIFPAASLIKLPVFVAIYQEIEKGNLSLTTSYKLQAKDKISGAGSMYYAPAGTVYTYEKMLELMGKQSDNTAFNVFVKVLGTEKIQAVIDELGMKDTSFAKNKTTPADIRLFFGMLYQGNRVNRENQEAIYDYLTDTIWEDRIPAGVPKGIKVVHKVGTEMGIYSDAGIVFGENPFVLVIMSEGIKEAEAKEVLPRITRIIWESWGNLGDWGN